MYELSRNRYKELKHFCLQYPEIKKELQYFKMQGVRKSDLDPTARVAIRINELEHAAQLIEMTAFDVGKFPGEKILKIVAEGHTIGEVCPFERDACEWYLKKFYWMLSERKGV